VPFPPDAYDGIVVDVLCAGPGCPELPLYSIRRGNSSTTVNPKTGALGPEVLAPGEEGAFTFLKEALRRPRPSG
jgi:hypothetical protein